MRDDGGPSMRVSAKASCYKTNWNAGEWLGVWGLGMTACMGVHAVRARACPQKPSQSTTPSPADGCSLDVARTITLQIRPACYAHDFCYACASKVRVNPDLLAKASNPPPPAPLVRLPGSRLATWLGGKVECDNMLPKLNQAMRINVPLVASAAVSVHSSGEHCIRRSVPQR